MQLSIRLQAICDLCDPGDIAADIGCDHGHVSIWLIQNIKFNKLIAMDINKGPLERARINASSSGLSNEHISFRLSNGLDKLLENEVDTIIIAGMGGLLISDILRAGKSKLGSVKQLILGPHSEEKAVRQTLLELGFSIKDESFVLDDGKYYQLIKACPIENAVNYSDVELTYGPVLLAGKNEVMANYINQEIIKKQDLIDNLIKLPTSDKVEIRINELNSELSLAKEALNRLKQH